MYIRGKIGKYFCGEEGCQTCGYWVFHLVGDIPGDKPVDLGVFGPFETEALAKKAMDNHVEVAAKAWAEKQNEPETEPLKSEYLH